MKKQEKQVKETKKTPVAKPKKEEPGSIEFKVDGKANVYMFISGVSGKKLIDEAELHTLAGKAKKALRELKLIRRDM